MLMIMISFLVIMISVTFVRYLSMAATGEIPLKNTLAYLGILLPNFISLLLPICLFLAVVVGMNRLLHENELLVGFACGMGFFKFVCNILRMALPVALIGVLLSYVIIPQMNRYQDQLQVITSQNSAVLNFIQSGRFFALSPKQIIYIGNIDFKNRNSQNIFLYQMTNKKTQIVIAPTGTVDSEGNSIDKINLNNGKAYEFTDIPDSLSVRMAGFNHLVMSLLPDYSTKTKDLSAVSSLQLIKNHDLQSKIELQWRSALPIATIVLAFLGVVLNDLQPRISKIIKIFYALVIFIIYFNLVSIAKALMLTGRVPLFPGLFAVHLLFLALGLILLFYREGWLHLITYRFKKHEKA